MARKQVHAAVNHCIEAGQPVKALDTAVAAHVAEQNVAGMSPADTLPYLHRIGSHHESTGDLVAAERASTRRYASPARFYPSARIAGAIGHRAVLTARRPGSPRPRSTCTSGTAAGTMRMPYADVGPADAPCRR